VDIAREEYRVELSRTDRTELSLIKEKKQWQWRALGSIFFTDRMT